MDIMELGAIGDLVGGVATRQTTNEFLREVSADPDLNKPYSAGLAGQDALPGGDRLRFDMALLQMG